MKFAAVLLAVIFVSILGGGWLGYFLSTRTPAARARLGRRLALGLGLALLAAGIFTYSNWRNRYRWPRKPVAWLQDLPAVDKTNWPQTPVAWRTETNVVDVATPDGLRPKMIVYHVNSLGMKFVRVEPGRFLQGVTEEQGRRTNSGKKVGFPVTLTKPYYLGAYAVTLELYEQFATQFRRVGFQRGQQFNEHPVVGVTWRDAQLFCRWLSEKEGRVYRLPTEAEWEYASKAGTTTILYWGDSPWDRGKANVGGIREAKETYVEDGYRYTSPVGVYPPNPWGFYDMAGNTWEWVNDWFDWLPDQPAIDPTGPATGRMRVKKGGSWATRTRHLRSSARDGNNPADLFELNENGFRVVCEAN